MILESSVEVKGGIGRWFTSTYVTTNAFVINLRNLLPTPACPGIHSVNTLTKHDRRVVCSRKEPGTCGHFRRCLEGHERGS